MGGPSSQSLNEQTQISQNQLALSEQQNQLAQQDYARRVALMQPAISFDQALTTGSRAAAFGAEAPVISNISQATTNAGEQIREQLPAGAAQEVALAENARAGQSGVASALSNAYTGAFDKLANLGAGIGSFSLQEIGAAISGGQAASQANQVNIQAGEQQKQSTMGLLGDLAGAAGTAAAGFA